MDSSQTKELAQRHGSHFLCSQCHTSCLATQSGAACQSTVGRASILSLLSAAPELCLKEGPSPLLPQLLLFTSLQSLVRGKFNHEKKKKKKPSIPH